MKNRAIRNRTLGRAAICTITALALVSCSKKEERSDRASPAESSRSSPNVILRTYSKMADVPLVAPDGTEYRLSHYSGSIVVLCVFATWNKDCAEQIPVLNTLHAQTRRLNTAVIGIVIDDDGPAALKRFAARQPISFPVFTNGAAIIRQLGGARRLPTTFILLRDGHIYNTALGVQSLRYFETQLRSIRAQRL